ncbi:MAG: molybdate ABC transporter substrate-binding protein [Armatimonadetes bacterium]|nr:molybdate ABC transporter substrate-binding protein [Armatimonadota bacterium]
MKRALLWFAIIVAMALAVVGCPPKQTENIVNDPPAAVAGKDAPAETLNVYIPCGLTVPLRETMAKFEETHPGAKLEGTYDNAITNALTIKEKGERPDLFISPGAREMEILEEQGLIDESTKTAIGFFELVVVTPKDNPKNIRSLEDMTKADVVSLPDPERNSIGVYGRQALEKAKLWDTLMPKGDERIVLTEFPINAYEMIASGKADTALMFRNCPMKTYPEKLQQGSVVIVADVDEKLYDEPLCYIAMLKDAPHPALAKEFIAFLAGNEAQKLLAENGLDALNERAQELLPAGIKNPTAPAAEPTPGVATVEGLKPPIKVEAYYPGNPDHQYLRELVEGLAKKYPGKVEGEFIDFTSDEGYVRWHDERKMSCGGLVINGKQTFLVDRKGTLTEVTFMMGEGGEWTREDLFWVLDQATGKTG